MKFNDLLTQSTFDRLEKINKSLDQSSKRLSVIEKVLLDAIHNNEVLDPKEFAKRCQANGVTVSI